MSHTAEELLEKSAEGDVEAMGILGETYLHGNKGLEVDYRLAYEWSKKAADMGYVRSYTNLGIMYMEGSYVNKDTAYAYELFTKAMDEGDMKAPRYIGLMYRAGELSSDNPDEEAASFFSIGAKNGDISSQFYLGEMYEKGIGVERNMDEAIKWYKKSAERGDKIAKPAMDALKRLGIK